MATNLNQQARPVARSRRRERMRGPPATNQRRLARKLGPLERATTSAISTKAAAAAADQLERLQGESLAKFRGLPASVQVFRQTNNFLQPQRDQAKRQAKQEAAKEPKRHVKEEKFMTQRARCARSSLKPGKSLDCFPLRDFF